MKPIFAWAILMPADEQGPEFLLGVSSGAPEIFWTRSQSRQAIKEWEDGRRFKPRPVRVEIRLVEKSWAERMQY